MEKTKELCFDEFTKIDPLRSELLFYQSNKNKNNSELILSHPKLKKIGHLVWNNEKEVKTNSVLNYKELNGEKFNPYDIEKKFISQGIDVFVIGCKGELKGVLSFEGDGGYDRVYTIHHCAGFWFNPVRWY